MPRSHLALFQKYLCGTTSRSGYPWSGVSGSPSAWVARSARSSSSEASGTFELKSCSAQATAKRADGSGRASAASSRQWTPSNPVSNRLQRVTQWMSWTLLSLGSPVNCSHVSDISSSTSPKTRNVHVARSACGTLPASRDGPLRGQVLTRRQPIRIETGLPDLPLLPPPEHVPRLARWGLWQRRRTCARGPMFVSGPDTADLLQRIISTTSLPPTTARP